MDEPLEISLLGGFTVSVTGRPLRGFESDKARALLAYLSTENERPHRRERVAGLLWPDLTEHRARRNLSQTLYNLRQVLAEPVAGRTPTDSSIILATPHEIRFDTARRIWLDVAAFRTGLLGCARHAPEPSTACAECLACRETAVDLYHGELLAGFTLPGCPAFEEWLLLERERLHRTALSALTTLAATCRRRGEIQRALGHAHRATTLDPLWEPARREIMHGLWLAGRRAKALNQFAAFRELLLDELGVEPDDLTRKLARRIQSDSEIVAPRSEGRHNLPHPLTRFIGRRREMAQIQDNLLDPACRLLTILGPGGCGKSRLALEAARPLTGDFPDGLFLISLSGLSSRAALFPALASVLGVPNLPDRNPKRQLFDFLKAKCLLLILDSCEALPDVAEVAVSLLHEAPRVKILATSRTRLNVQAETLHHLGGLALTDSRAPSGAQPSEAAQLFLSAAQRIVPGYEPDDANLDGVVTICRLAQGMPLSIILATAWLELISPAAIAAAMAASMDFLAVEWPDLPERQRSLRSTLEYSWGLLNRNQQLQLQALSVFRGGFSNSAAGDVAGTSKRDLLAFLNHALIQRLADDRLGIHDLLRQFLGERLATDLKMFHEIGQRHSRFYLHFAATLSRDLKSNGQQRALEQMDLESRNLVGAWAWAVEHDVVESLEPALESVCLYYELRLRYQEGAQACAAVAEMAGIRTTAPAFLVRVRVWQARFARLSGLSLNVEGELASCLELSAVLRDSPANAAATRGLLFWEMGEAKRHTDREGACEAYENSVALFRAAGSTWWKARAFSGLGKTHDLLGRYNEAIECHQHALVAFLDTAASRGVAAAQLALGNNFCRVGLFEEGERHYQAGIEILETIGDRAARTVALQNLSRLHWWQGRFWEDFSEMVDSYRNLGMRHELAFALAGGAMTRMHTGIYDQVVSDARGMRNELKELAFPRWQALADFVLGAAQLARGDLDAAWAPLLKARAILGEIGQLEELASSLAIAAAVALRRKRWELARPLIGEALETCLETRGLWSVIHTMPVVALFLAECGEPERAYEVYALAEKYPAVARSEFFRDIAGRSVAERVAAGLPPSKIEAAWEHGGSLDLWETVRELSEGI